MRAIAIASLLFALGCGGAPMAATTTPAEATSTSTTRYRVGDYVVYRYAGRLVGPTPLHLMEEVIAQDGDRLVIEVTLSRGHETLRAWRQTVVDTEQNRRTNHLEAICRIDAETCTPLDDPSGAGLAAMYDGLFLTPDGPATDVTETDEDLEVAGTSMHCHVRRTHITRDGEPLQTKDVECPDFLWGHAQSTIEMPDKRRVLLVSVESYGPPR